MMAFEPIPDVALAPSTVTELRTALSRSITAGSHCDELNTILTRAATEARQRGIQGEQLLLLLKKIWYSLPQLSPQPTSDTQARLLQQLISRCIQEYYRT